MAKVYEFLATGFEEIEALIPLDIMRRAGVEFKTVSVTGAKEVESAHGVKITADLLFEEADLSDADLLMLPGGLPGATNLNEHVGVKKSLSRAEPQGQDDRCNMCRTHGAWRNWSAEGQACHMLSRIREIS